MKTSQPTVSVLMTAYNREQFIGEAIESVLSSTLKDFELIVVDDASADKTVSIALEYQKKDSRIKIYINEQNIGDYPNRNKAAGLARGSYLKYLDSDDIMYPHCLEVMVDCMEKFPDAGYGLSAIPYEDQPFPICITPKRAYLENFIGKGHFGRAPGSSIIRRKAFEAVGGFSGERMIGDYKLWFTLSRSFDLVVMPRDLIWDRSHPEQEMKSDYAKNYDLLRTEVVREALAHSDCPLSHKEIEYVQRRTKIDALKRKIKQLF